MTRTVVNSTAYFNRLVELLINTKVTDLHGKGLSLDEGIDRAVELINGARPTGAKVMVIGNGGSAAIASHLQNDLSKAVGVRSLVFNEPSLLTALSNDHGYSCIFERPIQMWSEKDDVLLAISSSGRLNLTIRFANWET
jgi:D-sedoheptulose 7-phosphate isomerase